MTAKTNPKTTATAKPAAKRAAKRANESAIVAPDETLAALATLDATEAKPAPKRARKLAAVPNPPAAPTTTVAVEVMEPVAFQALDRLERIELMKAEAAATREWIAGGKAGTEPARPVNNAYALNVLAGGGSVKFAGRNGDGEPRSRSNFKPDALAEVLHRIAELREAGRGWPAIAKTFNDEGVPTAKGGQWHSSTVMGVAKRAGMPTRLDKPEAAVEAPAKPARDWDSRGRGRSRAAK